MVVSSMSLDTSCHDFVGLLFICLVSLVAHATEGTLSYLLLRRRELHIATLLSIGGLAKGLIVGIDVSFLGRR